MIKHETPSPFSQSRPAPPDPVEISNRTPIFCFPRAESFEAKIHLSRSIHIDKIRSVEIWCNTGLNDTQSLELRLRAATAGLRLHTGEATVTEGNVSVSQPEKARPGIIELANISPGSSFKLRIPFEVESHMADILIRIDAEYTTDNGCFVFFSHANIPIDLPLDVNVQDSFKPFGLFSTFSIRSSNQKPLQLLSAHLGDTGMFSVRGPMGGPWPRILFPKKPMSLQYIIKKTGKGHETEKDVLPLELEYQCLDEQVEAIAEAALAKCVSSSNFAHLRMLLLPFFVEKLMQHIEPEALAQITSRDELALPSFEAFGWGDVLGALPSPTRSDVQQWLEQWHKVRYPILFGLVSCSQPAGSPQTPPR